MLNKIESFKKFYQDRKISVHNFSQFLLIQLKGKWTKWTKGLYVFKYALFSVFLSFITQFEQILNDNL